MRGVGVVGARRRARTVAVAAVVAIATMAAACGGSSGGGSGHGSGALTRASKDPTGGAATDRVDTYGYGPSAAPGVTYQDDVVMVPAGPAAIRGASPDGLTWTLDGGADGVDALRVGSVLVATGRATGRVVEVHDRGGDRVVTLAPVLITDIVRDGKIDLSHALAADAVRYQHVPGQPAVVTEPSAADLAGGRATTKSLRSGSTARIVTAAVRRPSAGTAGSDDDLPPASKGSVEIEAGDYKVTPAYSPGELALDVQRDGHIKVGVHLAFSVSELSVDAGMSIADGVAGGTRFVVHGIDGLTVSLAAGTEDGDNDKVRVEIPVEATIPIPPSPATAGLPLEITIEFTFSVETALTGRNSTITALGKYGLEGPIGVQGGDILSPTFTVEQSIIDSLAGITLGPSGVVFAVKMKVQAGLGIPEANAGPYGFVTTSIGVTNGSSLGASLARCRGATLDMEVGGGVAYEISSVLFDALKRMLPPGTDIPDKAEAKKNVLHRSQIVPDVPLCTGAGG
jgi:hypothetical protein